MNYEHANQVTAKACGVTYSSTYLAGRPNYWKIKSIPRHNVWHPDEWTIEDPVCREVIRNWWLSQDSKRGVMFTNGECWYYTIASHSVTDVLHTRKANEEACILAIVESIDNE